MELENRTVSMSLINNFRERVNRRYFVYNKYLNYEGKNKWSIICSSMDWISVAISYLEKHPIPEKDQNDNIYSVNVFTYISCVDMVLEAVKQLNAVLTGENKKYPFDGVKTIFKNNLYCADDNKYFKTIRACFGAHSVNLNDYFSSSEMEHRYASWSGDVVTKGDYSVFLYSNIPGKDMLRFDIYFSEIAEFLIRTYEKIEDFIKIIDNDEAALWEEWRSKPIEKSDNVSEQLKVLKRENNDRWQNDHYGYIIDQLILIFETSITDDKNRETVEKFRDYLCLVINEIYDILQNMQEKEIDKWDTVSSATTKSDAASYGFGKLLALANGVGDYIIGVDPLFEYVKPYVFIRGTESYQEQYVLALSGLLVRYLEEKE